MRAIRSQPQPPTPDQIARARDLRKESNMPERVLSNQLKNRPLGGFKFRRQHPIAGCTVDFYCAETALVVELDGYETHRPRARRDATRDTALASLGLHVLRVSVSSLAQNADGVLRRILQAATERARSAGPPLTPPSPPGRGEGAL